MKHGTGGGGGQRGVKEGQVPSHAMRPLSKHGRPKVAQSGGKRGGQEGGLGPRKQKKGLRRPTGGLFEGGRAISVTLFSPSSSLFEDPGGESDKIN